MVGESLHVTGKSEYLEKSDEALRFMYRTAWDSINTGWINSIDKYGVASNPTENKQHFFNIMH